MRAPASGRDASARSGAAISALWDHPMDLRRTGAPKHASVITVETVPVRRDGDHSRRIGIDSGRGQNPCQIPAVMERIVSIGGHDICEFHGPAL